MEKSTAHWVKHCRTLRERNLQDKPFHPHTVWLLSITERNSTWRCFFFYYFILHLSRFHALWNHISIIRFQRLRCCFSISEVGWKSCDNSPLSILGKCNSPLISNLSSNVALKAPAGARRAFLICPRIPLTVRIAAPSNLATSNWELNMPWKRELPTISQDAKLICVIYISHKNISNPHNRLIKKYKGQNTVFILQVQTKSKT